MARSDTGKTFDAFNPPKTITDPQKLGANRDWPAMMFKWAGYHTADDCPCGVDHGGKLPTVGRDKRKIELQNDHIVVANEEEKAAAKKEGWAESPVLTEPKK